MLCQFTFSNFKSYKDEVTLDMCPANISEHPETLIIDEADGTKYLPVAAIYGPNGGGKSNVIEAFDFLRRTVLVPPRLDGNKLPSGNGFNHRSNTSEKLYFLFDDSGLEAPSSFEIIFRVATYEYKYILKIKGGFVTEENLYVTDIQLNKAMLVFERTNDKIILGEPLDGARTENINPAMPLIQYLAVTYDHYVIKSAIAWFDISYAEDYGDPDRNKTIFVPALPEQAKLAIDMLNEMDIPIKAIRIEENEDGEIANVFSEYMLANNRKYLLNFSQESAGTRKLLSFLELPLIVLINGGTLFVDELDANLHPKMLEYIIKLFTNPTINKRGAQLIFTSHDLYTMNNSLFRRDEIWFAARGADLSSRLYSLSEFKKGKARPRKDESYGKQYIEGRYGADPYLKKIIDWEE